MSSLFSRRWFGPAVGSALLVLAAEGAARAEAPASDAKTKEKAAALWREARDLRDQQRHSEACAKFRQSLEVLRAPGTLANVAACFMLENEPERAYATFEEVIAAAASEDSERRATISAAARKEMEAIEQQFARVALYFTPAEGLEIRLSDDGRGYDRLVQREDAARLLLKPGTYQLRAAAPGREPYSRTVEAAAGARASISIPRLESLAAGALLAPEAAPQPAEAYFTGAEPAAAEESAPARVLPLVLTGVGAAIVSAGVVTGVITAHKEDELEQECGPDFRCPGPEEAPGWQDKIDRTKRLAIVTDVLWGTGLATIGVGVALMYLGVDADADEAQVGGGCLGSSCEVTLQGRF